MTIPLKNNELINLVKEMAFQGEDFDSIFLELDKRKDSFPKEAIFKAKSNISFHIANYQLAKQQNTKALTLILLGSILFLIGISITTFTYFSANNYYILAYGAILAGVWNIYAGFLIYKKPLEDLIPRKRIYRR